MSKASNQVVDTPTGYYDCPEHGEFPVVFISTTDATWAQPCPACGLMSEWAARAPASKFKYTWNDNANEMRRDPYTQAKYQAKHAYHEQKDLGQEAPKPTEDGIQAGAKRMKTPPLHPYGIPRGYKIVG